MVKRGLLKVLYSLCLLFLAVLGQAQSKITVRSQADKQPIPFALLVEKEGTKGLVADQSGVLNMPAVALEAENTFIISATGYNELEIKSEALAQVKEVFLLPKAFELDEFTITSSNLEPVMLGDTLWTLSIGQHRAFSQAIKMKMRVLGVTLI